MRRLISPISRAGLANYTLAAPALWQTLLWRQRHIQEQTNRKGGDRHWFLGGLVTLPSLIPRLGLIDFLFTLHRSPYTLLSWHNNTREHICVHISAGIMKCVSCDQGAASICQMSLFTLTSFSWKLWSPFFFLSLFTFSLHLFTPIFGHLQTSSLKWKKIHRAKCEMELWGLAVLGMIEGN